MRIVGVRRWVRTHPTGMAAAMVAVVYEVGSHPPHGVWLPAPGLTRGLWWREVPARGPGRMGLRYPKIASGKRKTRPGFPGRACCF